MPNDSELFSLSNLCDDYHLLFAYACLHVNDVGDRQGVGRSARGAGQPASASVS